MKLGQRKIVEDAKASSRVTVRYIGRDHDVVVLAKGSVQIAMFEDGTNVRYDVPLEITKDLSQKEVRTLLDL